jgi:hypothetical protein
MSLPFIPSDSVDSTKVDLFQERRTRHDSDISEGEVGLYHNINNICTVIILLAHVN